ncbi:hypothetical protein TNCV_1698261 [Trichonephila clavipes]|nr:hypothetical protein TNCV_1698261 [Trichonephila clavipes]
MPWLHRLGKHSLRTYSRLASGHGISQQLQQRKIAEPPELVPTGFRALLHGVLLSNLSSISRVKPCDTFFCQSESSLKPHNRPIPRTNCFFTTQFSRLLFWFPVFLKNLIE